MWCWPGHTDLRSILGAEQNYRRTLIWFKELVVWELTIFWGIFKKLRVRQIFELMHTAGYDFRTLWDKLINRQTSQWLVWSMRGLSTIDMEKGYHGSEVHSDAKASSFPLDLGAMLDGTESPLQKQVYEYFQDPLSFPESIGQAQGEDGFSNAFPPYLTCSSPLEAGQSSFQSMHVEIIQAAATNVLRRREPNGFLHDNGRDETQITQYTSNTETRTSTVTQFTTNGSSAQGQMQLRSTNRNCLPHQRLYSADHKPGNDIESKFFHAPAPPKLVHSSKPANSHVSGENSDYETSCSPNAQKTTGRELLSPQLRTVRSHKSQRIGCEQRMKSKRLTDQAEHILRERQRRDDMSNKFLMLESLLPPGPKVMIQLQLNQLSINYY